MHVCSTHWWTCCLRWWWVSRTLCAASNPTTTGRRCVSARRGWWCSCATRGSWRRWTSAARATPTASPLESLSAGTNGIWTGNTEPCSQHRCWAVGALLWNPSPVLHALYPRIRHKMVFTWVWSFCWWKYGICATQSCSDDCLHGALWRKNTHSTVGKTERNSDHFGFEKPSSSSKCGCYHI